MSLTRDFKQTIKARIVRDPAFREELPAAPKNAVCVLAGTHSALDRLLL